MADKKQFNASAVADAVRKQINANRPDKSGYRRVNMQGTHLSVVQAPDGHYIGQFNHTMSTDINGGIKSNPKASITFASKEKLLALKAEIDQAIATAEVVEVLNKNKPVQSLSKVSGGVSLF